MKTAKKQSKPSRGSGNDLLDALREYDQQRAKDRKRDRRRKKLRWLGEVPGKVRAAIAVAAAVFVGLVVDGLRREGQEFTARLAAFQGSVTVTQGATVPTVRNMALRDRAVVRTGRGATATLLFPDGSSLQLEPETEFEVRLLDYARGAVRDRSFMVRAGAVVASVSQFFGAQSRATVCTPTAVAAVRGTGFRVVYDPASARTYLQVAEGTVRFRTPVGEMASTQGQMATSVGYELQVPRDLPARRARALTGQVQQLTGRYVRAPNLLVVIETGLNNLLDPVLQVVGLAPGSWSYSATNFARRTTCMEAFRRLHQHMEATFPEDVPPFVNPVTLLELNLADRERDAILNTCAGYMLEGYQKLGQANYVFRARARDKRRTLITLTPEGVR